MRPSSPAGEAGGPEAAPPWRHALLAGAACGLALSPLTGQGPGGGVAPGAQVLAGVAAAVLLAVTRPGAGRAPRAVWLGLLALAAALAGIAVGAARLAAIDGGALDLDAGSRVEVEGIVASVPRRADGEVRVQVETRSGRLLVEAFEPVPELPVGRLLSATGVIRDPGEWERSYLERQGIADVLGARELWLEPGRRGGLVGALDGVRTRAETALGRGTTPEAAALLRGFVLGQDDRIDEQTREEFKRSGLAHLLAVSGQNVILLALLAAAVLAVLGVPRRSRLLWILALIALYVPVAGAGPSIQRAGVMGAAGVVAALASRPASRAYALLLAALVTLALNPRASGDVGWQLSFAAVLGIFAFAGPISSLLTGSSSSPWRSTLAEGAAVSLAATVATTPLMALQFGVVSLVSLPANLLALPAVAPVMWLGMLAAAAGQLAWLPVEPLTAPAGLLAGFIAQIGQWLSAPGWAQREVELGGGWALALVYAALGLALVLILRVAARRHALRPAPVRRRAGRRAARIAAVAALALTAVLFGLSTRSDTPASTAQPGLTVSVLDIGQGDSILLEPENGDPVLVDAGGADAGVAGMLADRGVTRLAALVITHPQADHSGGAPAVLRELEVGRLLSAVPDRVATRAAEVAGTPTVELARGSTLRSGRLRVEVLWPPAEVLDGSAASAADPNHLSLVLLARWRSFEILLTGDAEAEAVPIDPGPVDVLKVAHHGSEDAGLPGLLARASPELAAISAGAENPYGHPAPQTLEMLARAGVAIRRTDLGGELTIEVWRRRWRVR